MSSFPVIKRIDDKFIKIGSIDLLHSDVTPLFDTLLEYAESDMDFS